MKTWRVSRQMLLSSLLALWAVTIGQACGGRPGPHMEVAPETIKTGAGSSGGSGISYQDVKPIFESRCMACHTNIAPKWTDYNAALAYVQNGKLKLRVVTLKTMPQVGSPQASAITDAERSLIGQWADLGGPEFPGSPVETPVGGGGGTATPPPTFAWDAAAKCVGCHGTTATNDPRVPVLAGQRAGYILAQLQSFRADRRTDQVMAQMPAIAKSLTDEEMRVVAAIYSNLTPATPTGTFTGNYDRVRSNLNMCKGCHSPQNGGANYPFLNGQNKAYLIDQLVAFQQRSRTDYIVSDFMNLMANDLSATTIDELAEYLSLMKQGDQFP
ncbi:MAG: c-type cytochrome [Bdellovibrionaceae bacterium]|nr:c-type cytochrome [Pseudobdellovibrionaceae bacterium]